MRLDLAHELDVAVDSARPAAEAKSIALRSDHDPEPVVIEGDAHRIQQTIANLLSNALKFTPAGGAVRASLRTDGGVAVLEVNDSGIGIAPDFLPHVFERFRQAESGAARRHDGLGLGLAIVKHLVESHGGSVEAAGEGEGRGSTIRLRLPLSDRPRASVPPATSGDASSRSGSTLAGLRVLLVEDDTDARDMLAHVLSDAGVAVTAAATAREAMAAFLAEQPDVLVSDIGMPGEDGCALIQKIRTLRPEAGGATPALAVSAYAQESDRARAFGAGFSDFVPKPVELDGLFAALTRLASHDVASHRHP